MIKGWGLPVAEAMAMSLPVVVPNHTGLSAFCTHDNSYLVPVEQNKKDKIGFYKISSRLFRDQMRKVYNDSLHNPRYLARVGERAREDMMKYYSPTRVVSLIAERINYLAYGEKNPNNK